MQPGVEDDDDDGDSGGDDDDANIFDDCGDGDSFRTKLLSAVVMTWYQSAMILSIYFP